MTGSIGSTTVGKGGKGDEAAGNRETLSAHASREGVWFDSRAWIVKARRR
jgi:hypothetical protein